MALAKLFQTLTVWQLQEELRHCKQIIEAGEMPTIANQPAVSRMQQALTQREVSV